MNLFQAILHFVNQNMSTMGLQVADMDKQVTKKTARTAAEPCFVSRTGFHVGKRFVIDYFLRLYHLPWSNCPLCFLSSFLMV